jgi:uncharacterized membrane protein
MIKTIKTLFWNGLKVFIPIVLTLAIIFWVFEGLETFMASFLRPIIPEKYYFHGLGLLVGVMFIFILGILVKSWMIRHFYRSADKLIKRIPVIKTVYTAIQDLLNFFDKSQEAQQAVMVQMPFGKVIGFITQGSLKNLSVPLGDHNEVLVYIPLSYIIGGITMIISKENLTPLDWPANKAMSFILTAGMGERKTGV